MKKMMTVLLTVMLVAGLAMSASADTCTGCKGNLGQVPFPEAREQQTCTASAFDYDGYWLNDIQMNTGTADAPVWAVTNRQGPSGQYGYCLNGRHKLIFKVCECGTAQINANMKAGMRVGVQMDILTTGVYWSAPNMYVGDYADPTLGNIPSSQLTKLALGRFATEADACAATYYNQYTARMPYSADELDVDDYDSDGNTTEANPFWSGDSVERLNYLAAERANQTPPYPWAPKSRSDLGIVRYFKDATCAINQAVTPYGGNECTFKTENKAKSLQSLSREGYVISKMDELYNVSYWWIDVPPMRLDATEAKAGEVIQIKVSLLGQREGTICASCTPFCSCIIDIARIGCDARGDLLFPYVVQQAGNRKTGIAIANLSVGQTIVNPTVNFTMVDSTGTVFKASTPMTKQVWAWELDALISGADALTWVSTPAGRTVAPGFAWMCINGNFAMDGYSFIQDGNFGGSVLPRTGVVCK
jgi:hypothetical protein